MQTICPHCQTVFKVSDEHLSAADGYVRCGICKEVFNALEKPTAEAEEDPSAESLMADETNDTTKTVTAGNSNPTEPAVYLTTTRPDSENHPELPGDPAMSSPTTAEPAKEISDAVVDSAQADLFSEASPQTVTHSPSSSAEISALETIESDTETATSVMNPDIQGETETPAQVDHSQTELQETFDRAVHEEEAAESPTTASTASSKSTAETTGEPEATATSTSDHEAVETDLFDGVQSKLIPDEYRIPELHNTSSLWRDIAWSLAILVFTATLFAEYIWFNRNALISDPQLRPLVTQFCAIANCNTMNLREPAKIEMTTRNIYSHPNVKNALMISGTLINHARFDQPYPNMLIDFSDVRGEVIASRIFTPEHYMQIKLDSLKLMPPETPVDFNMEIQDPGNDAMTYEFSFL